MKNGVKEETALLQIFFRKYVYEKYTYHIGRQTKRKYRLTNSDFVKDAKGAGHKNPNTL